MTTVTFACNDHSPFLRSGKEMPEGQRKGQSLYVGRGARLRPKSFAPWAIAASAPSRCFNDRTVAEHPLSWESRRGARRRIEEGCFGFAQHDHYLRLTNEQNKLRDHIFPL